MKEYSDIENDFKEKVRKGLQSIVNPGAKLTAERSMGRFYNSIKDLDKEDAQVVKSLKFVSVRGRTAWSICCLENALEKFEAYNSAWNVLLTKMWEHTQISKNDVPSLEVWKMFMYYLAPAIKYSDFANDLQAIINWYDKEYLIPTQKDFDMLHKAFENTNSCLVTICRNIQITGTERLLGGTFDVGSQESYATIEIIKVMRKSGVSLPAVEPFVGYEYIEDYDDEFALGPAFDGTQYSKFINKK